MVIGLTPCFGEVSDGDSSINVAATHLWNRILKEISGNRAYDPNDLAISATAVSSCYDWIVFLKRCYKMASTFSNQNRYMYDRIAEAIGFDLTSIQENLERFRGQVNVLISKLATYSMPGDIPFFVRNIDRFSKVFKEGDSVKNQLYVFYPESVLQFDLIDNSGALFRVQPFRFADHLLTADELIDVGTKQVAAIREWLDDFGRIISDIERAVGSNTFKLQLLSEDYADLEPEFNIAALEQIKNAVVTDTAKSYFMYPRQKTEKNDMQQAVLYQNENKGLLLSSPSMMMRANDETTPEWEWRAEARLLKAFYESKILTTGTDAVTADLTLSNSALVVSATGAYTAPVINKPTVVFNMAAGSDVATQAKVVGWRYDAANKKWVHWNRSTSWLNLFFLNEATEAPQEIYEREMLSNFKYHPAERTILTRQGTNPAAFNFAAYSGFVWDLDNYTVLDQNEIPTIHAVEMLLLWNVDKA